MYKLLLTLIGLIFCSSAFTFTPNLRPTSPTIYTPNAFNRLLITIKTQHTTCPTPFSQFVFLKLPYWGFDQRAHVGTLVIDKKIAKETSDIFQEIYLHHFPIRRLESSFTLKGMFYSWLESDNTEGFSGCRRQIGSVKKFSLHSYGRAIDINPIENPYIKGNMVIPLTGRGFIDRHLNKDGMIKNNDVVCRAFNKYKWRWGGHWRTRKDYMHFEKS